MGHAMAQTDRGTLWDISGHTKKDVDADKEGTCVDLQIENDKLDGQDEFNQESHSHRECHLGAARAGLEAME